MKYTLIVPHYNDTDRLNRLLKTVPVFRSDVEVLVIDDCSDEQTELTALKEAWPEVSWLSTIKNSGAGAARNVGLSNAMGKYLVFADSDDEFLFKAFDVFDESIGENDELIYFLAEGRQDADGSSSVRADSLNRLCRECLDKKTPRALELLKLRHAVPWAKVYSKEVVDKLNIKFEETKVSNDIAFNVLTAIYVENIKVVPKATYRVYRRGGSLTANPKPEAFLERMEVSARLAKKLKELNLAGERSATGYILQSLSYDPKTVLKAIYIGITSDLDFNILRILNVPRWFSYFHRHLKDKREKSAAKK